VNLVPLPEGSVTPHDAWVLITNLRRDNAALRAALSTLVTEADEHGGNVRTVSRYSVDKARLALSPRAEDVKGGSRE